MLGLYLRLSGSPEVLRRIAEIEARLAGDPAAPERLQLLDALAGLQVLAGRLDAAEETSRRRLAETQVAAERHAAARALADVWRLGGTLDTRVRTLEARLAAAPEDTEAILVLGEVFRDLSPDRAHWIALHERLIPLTPDDPLLVRRLETAYREDNNPASLFQLYRDVFRAARTERQRVETRDGLIQLWWEFGRTEEAVARLEAVRAGKPDDAEALAFLAEIYWRDLDRHKDQALPVYETLAREHPGDLHLQQRLIEVYYRNGLYAEEIRLAQDLADRFPESRFDQYVFILTACARMGDMALFKQWKDRMLAAFGDQAWAYAKTAGAANDFGRVHADPEIWELVIAVCDQGLAGPAAEAAKAPYIPHIVGSLLIQKAMACARLGRHQEAEALFHRVERDGISKQLRDQAAEFRKQAFEGKGLAPSGSARGEGMLGPR